MRTQTNIKQLVGRIGSEYYICDYLFEDGQNFKGATATVLRSVSQVEYEERTDPEGEYVLDWFDDLWRESVAAGNTTKSLKDFIEEALAVNGDEAVFDFSGYNYWDLIREAESELTEENYPVFECVAGGRSFYSDMKFDKIYNKKLWEQIKEIEN